MEKLKTKIEELVEELYPATGVKDPVEWNGYQVYVPIYKKPSFIGYPFVILVKGDEARISTAEESLDFLDFQDKNKTN